MNSSVLAKLVLVVVMSASFLLIGSQKQKKPSIQVEWHITGVRTRFASIKDPAVRKENKKRSVNFGLTDDKGYYGIVEIEAFYNDKNYSALIKPVFSNERANNKHDWVLLVPTDIVNEKKNTEFKKSGNATTVLTQKVVQLKEQFSLTSEIAQPGELCYNKPEFYNKIARNLGFEEEFFSKATSQYAHPRYIPAGWIMDKKVGDKILLQAHGYDVVVTIASLPKDDSDQAHLLKFLKYAPRVVKGFFAVCLLGFLIKYLRS